MIVASGVDFFRKMTLPKQKWDTEFEDHIYFMKLSVPYGLRIKLSCKYTLIMLFSFENTVWIFGLILLEIAPFFHLGVCVQEQWGKIIDFGKLNDTHSYFSLNVLV